MPAIVRVIALVFCLTPGSLPAQTDAQDPTGTRKGVSVTTSNVQENTANGCWARLFVREDFQGPALTLVGSTEVDNIARRFGFPWEPLYESVQVGPRATLSVFDEPEFRERTTQFGPGQRIADLDRVMGIFRTIRSAKLACS